jgi:hypothetical protein
MELKPGQVCTLYNNVFRARKKEYGCKGCYFEHAFFTCPGMFDQRKMCRKVDCLMSNIILVLVTKHKTP